MADEGKAVETLFYRLLDTSVLLHRHAHGEPLDRLAAAYGVHSGNLESGLKYTALWVLSCLAQICTGARCYKLDFLALTLYDLIEDLSLGSTLGKLLTIRGVGRTTVERLRLAGIEDPGEPRLRDQPALLALGIPRKQADAVARFSRRQAR